MEQPSRRAVLRAAVLASAVVAVPGVMASGASGASLATFPTRLRRSVFTPQVGTTFLLVQGRRTYPAVLVAVGDVTARDRGHESRFSLLFRVPDMPPEGIYAVSNARLREADLFVASVGPRSGMVYEAVVNA